MFNSSNSFLVSGITTNKNLQDAQLNLNKNYCYLWNYNKMDLKLFTK